MDLGRPISRRSASMAALALLAGFAPAAAAAAGETRYTYDARGRLVAVNQIGGGSDYEARYSYDKADNRLSYAVTDARAPMVIVPTRGGYRVISIGR